jgi:hypothetical protein
LEEFGPLPARTLSGYSSADLSEKFGWCQDRYSDSGVREDKLIRELITV